MRLAAQADDRNLLPLRLNFPATVNFLD